MYHEFFPIENRPEWLSEYIAKEESDGAREVYVHGFESYTPDGEFCHETWTVVLTSYAYATFCTFTRYAGDDKIHKIIHHEQIKLLRDCVDAANELSKTVDYAAELRKIEEATA